MKINALLFLAIMSLIIVACGEDEPDPMPVDCDTVGMTYTDDIAAIIDKSCAAANGCHIDGTLATFEMHDYATTKIAVDNPNWNIVASINQEMGVIPMPYATATTTSDKIPQCDIDQITAWIDAGAPQ